MKSLASSVKCVQSDVVLAAASALSIPAAVAIPDIDASAAPTTPKSNGNLCREFCERLAKNSPVLNRVWKQIKYRPDRSQPGHVNITCGNEVIGHTSIQNLLSAYKLDALVAGMNLNHSVINRIPIKTVEESVSNFSPIVAGLAKQNYQKIVANKLVEILGAIGTNSVGFSFLDDGRIVVNVEHVAAPGTSDSLSSSMMNTRVVVPATVASEMLSAFTDQFDETSIAVLMKDHNLEPYLKFTEEVFGERVRLEKDFWKNVDNYANLEFLMKVVPDKVSDNMIRRADNVSPELKNLWDFVNGLKTSFTNLARVKAIFRCPLELIPKPPTSVLSQFKSSYDFSSLFNTVAKPSAADEIKRAVYSIVAATRRGEVSKRARAQQNYSKNLMAATTGASVLGEVAQVYQVDNKAFSDAGNYTDKDNVVVPACDAEQYNVFLKRVNDTMGAIKNSRAEFIKNIVEGL